MFYPNFWGDEKNVTKVRRALTGNIISQSADTQGMVQRELVYKPC